MAKKPCERCGNPIKGRFPQAKYCLRCVVIVRKEVGQRAMRAYYKKLKKAREEMAVA